VIRALNRLLDPLVRRIRSIVSRAIVTGANESTLCRELQVVAQQDEVLDGIEHVEPYGFTARPSAQAEAVLLSQGGRRANTVAIVVGDRRYRLTSLTEGQVALYDQSGASLILNNDGTITINASGGVTVNCDLSVAGNVSATGDVSDGTRSMQQMVTTFNSHLHTGNLGNPTSPPTTPMT